jgi:hypothetical protein
MSVNAQRLCRRDKPVARLVVKLKNLSKAFQTDLPPNAWLEGKMRSLSRFCDFMHSNKQTGTSLYPRLMRWKDLFMVAAQNGTRWANQLRHFADASQTDVVSAQFTRLQPASRRFH